MAFNPNQPRDSHGRFGEIAGEALSALGHAARSAAHTATSLAQAIASRGHVVDNLNGYKVFKPGPHLENVGDDPSVPHLSTEMWKLHRDALGAKATKEFYQRHRDAFERYTTIAYRGLNEGLRYARGGVLPNHQLWVNSLDSAISAGKMPYDAVLHRGVGPLVNRMLQPGNVVHDYGYQSATLNRSYADMFRRKARNEGGANLHLLVKKGATALPLDKMSSMPEEYEVLFPRGSSYRVIHREGHDVYAELL
jgi:hypothetical protein